MSADKEGFKAKEVEAADTTAEVLEVGIAAVAGVRVIVLQSTVLLLRRMKWGRMPATDM